MNMNFETWWYTTGSGIGVTNGHDHEEHGKKIAEIAWSAALDRRGIRPCDDCESLFPGGHMVVVEAPLGTIWRCEQCAEKAWDRQQESN